MKHENEKERALIFLERKIIVHVSTNRDNGFFCNGILLEVGNDFFVIMDRVGNYEHFIFFNELKKPLEPYKEK